MRWALATSFALGHETLTTMLFFGLFALALMTALYRAELVLGFVLGMSFVFGAVLPTGIACIFAALSGLLQVLARWLGRALRRLVAWVRASGSG